MYYIYIPHSVLRSLIIKFSNDVLRNETAIRKGIYFRKGTDRSPESAKIKDRSPPTALRGPRAALTRFKMKWAMLWDDGSFRHKRILQTHMRSHRMGLDVWFLVPFVYFVPRSPFYLLRGLHFSTYSADFNARNKSLTAKLLLQGYRYHKLRKIFSKFYRRHYKLVSKFNVGLKTLLHQGLSEPEFYGDLIYKFRKIVGRADFSDQFKKNYRSLQTYWVWHNYNATVCMLSV